ncbi:MAG: Uncharacterized protein G01um101418_107 [Parcubacteria group bacterium Gr01-1014_18]|nr:MAG: Uncharacterized protein Greene041636_411 [Parcubacteria group bacterium Greene0416_36]TSC81434.1 MAG: Uncharacterized protein G01um101418_107 [Parcubacteria group bacterium Gr01-1014_18]TSC99032.1 MAG: Uncharacterized protein Greene101420_388 [Parcubacteria group bacterium Greene1014_20]TSD07287.1 MAG: Uncharacterized protein Greene07142_303 [Parcubacteria group bacterium Greene0714_2]
MHLIQKQILKIAQERNLRELSLRAIGELIGEPNSPQKIKHHMESLMAKGLLVASEDGQSITPMSTTIDPKYRLASIPIYGAANCGQALVFAQDHIEGYLKLSFGILGPKNLKKVGDLFVLKAAGTSMNRADIKGKSIDDGDFVIIEKTSVQPEDGAYVVSIIDGSANIKKFFHNKDEGQIILLSESTQNHPPIYIHESDYSDYVVCGRVIDVMKKPDELCFVRNKAAEDIFRQLGPISRGEYDYYENL